jgi:hypothetical protein
MTRREFAALAAVPTLTLDSALVRSHDKSVEAMLQKQILTPGHPQRGNYPDDYGIFFVGTAGGILSACLAAYVTPESRYYRSQALVERVKLAAAHMVAHQNEDGTIDLPITNFHSTPDTAFVVHGAAMAEQMARKAKLELPDLRQFLRRAGDMLVHGGIHTPNHRWVVCQALAQLNELWPDKRYEQRIAQWLAEGIDIDADGQFTERSTTIYNTVSDNALSVVALKTGRPELLDVVRRNLDSMLYFIHPDGEVVTDISTRQDKNLRAFMDRYWFPLRLLAIRLGDGRYATLVRSIEARSASLAFLICFPELNAPLPASKPLPESYHQLMPAVKAVRVRRGQRSASILLNGDSRFFTLRHGACVLEAVRLGSAFFGKAQFRAQHWEKAGDGYRLTQTLKAPYYQPFDPPRRVEASDYDSTRLLRRQTEIQTLVYDVIVRETKRGFALEVDARGTNGVPLALELCFRENVQLDAVAAIPLSERAFVPTGGTLTARVGQDSIRVKPAFAEHRWVDWRGAESRLRGKAVFLCGFTPFKRVIEFETGD